MRGKPSFAQGVRTPISAQPCGPGTARSAFPRSRIFFLLPRPAVEVQGHRPALSPSERRAWPSAPTGPPTSQACAPSVGVAGVFSAGLLPRPDLSASTRTRHAQTSDARARMWACRRERATRLTLLRRASAFVSLRAARPTPAVPARGTPPSGRVLRAPVWRLVVHCRCRKSSWQGAAPQQHWRTQPRASGE